MNKAELVEALAQHYDGNRLEAARALNAVVQTITRSAVAGERVAITGFGVFEKVDRPARTVRNPRTGERKEAPATSVPRFRAGTELKAYVAGDRELPALVVEPSAAAPRARRASAPPSAAPVEVPAPTGKAAALVASVTQASGTAEPKTAEPKTKTKTKTKKASGKPKGQPAAKGQPGAKGKGKGKAKDKKK